jgi:hypothetical protein
MRCFFVCRIMFVGNTHLSSRGMKQSFCNVKFQSASYFLVLRILGSYSGKRGQKNK